MIPTNSIRVTMTLANSPAAQYYLIVHQLPQAKGVVGPRNDDDNDREKVKSQSGQCSLVNPCNCFPAGPDP